LATCNPAGSVSMKLMAVIDAVFVLLIVTVMTVVPFSAIVVPNWDGGVPNVLLTKGSSGTN